MAKNKSQPMRMCIACRDMKPKKEMFRVVKNAEGEFRVDLTGNLPGRGAYICGAESCQKKLTDKKLLNRAFATNVSQEVYLDFKEEVLGEK